MGTARRIRIHKLTYTFDYPDYTTPTISKITSEDVVEIFAVMKPKVYTVGANDKIRDIIHLSTVRDEITYVKSELELLKIKNKQLHDEWFDKYVESVLLFGCWFSSDTSALIDGKLYLAPEGVKDEDMFTDTFCIGTGHHYGESLGGQFKVYIDRNTKFGFEIINNSDRSVNVTLNFSFLILAKKESENILLQWSTKL